ncbi:amidohydrolase family protein [Falsiroseomonas selenitidurans]|uniref:Amidohydrolase family protein n=1 Tax=Falsiroseomonas selenitidurans TaxID=2716335 RepID=A0ABX1E381_9PROT|nr:amidohydrolase family protein [Falsiroseomonas selenitidurans]NKC31488.1 amidohydrolase family protein [Falsiroseomonas selenitidurans]
MTETPEAAGLGRRRLMAAGTAALGAAPLVAPRPSAAQPAAAQPLPAPDQPILLRGAHILSMDPAIGDLPRGDILIEAGRIRAVAPEIAGPEGALVLEGAGRIALPGMVNGHIHLAQTMQRGLSTEHSFVGYFQTIVLRHSNRMTPDDVALADQVGAQEQIAAGVTTVMDWSRETMSPDHADAALAGLDAAGIRAVLAYTAPPVPQGAEAGPIQARMLDHARRLLARRAAGLVRIWTCLQGPDFAPLAPALADMRRLAELGVPIAIHTGASIYANRKPRLLAQLDAAGLLNERLQIIHANNHEPDEYRLAAARGVMLCSTPEVELRMGHGHPSLFRAAAAGMRVSVGTDIPSMVGGGLLPQLRVAMAAEMHRMNLESIAATGTVATPPRLTARQMLHHATLGGAAGLGLDGITGSLTPGKGADVILVRADSPLTAPLGDAAGLVLLQSGPGDVETVIVDGRLRKRDGLLTDPEAGRRRARLQARAAAMAAAAG